MIMSTHRKVRSFTKGGVLVRIEYPMGHGLQGEIRHYKDGKHVRTEYASWHPRHPSKVYPMPTDEEREDGDDDVLR